MASKYRKYDRKEIAKPPPNPIWRGVGCILVVVVPLLSYFFMTLFLPVVKGTGQVPPELLANVVFPTWVSKVPIINNIALNISAINEFWLKAVIFVVIMLLLMTVSGLIWSVVYQVAGPPRYTEMDAPEMDRGAERYKR